MEGVKHVWRKAACVLFVTGPFKYCPQKAPGMRGLIEAHVRGARPPTTCFLEKDPQQSHREDMEIMFVQRHSKSGFMVSESDLFICIDFMFYKYASLLHSRTCMCFPEVFWTKPTTLRTG